MNTSKTFKETKMNIEIALFDSTTNKIIKTEILNVSYVEAESIVSIKNNKLKNPNKYWKVLNINV